MKARNPRLTGCSGATMTERLRIAVVGHSNTGKTSLLRTLTRDPDFGQVADEAGTTRHVQGALLRLPGEGEIEWFDTPGMEDSVALLEYLDLVAPASERLDGPARIQRLLDTPEARGRYEQEARVLDKLLACDAGLYVIDARDPVLSKHRDELALLAACGRPLLPVLNFVHAPGHRARWRAWACMRCSNTTPWLRPWTASSNSMPVWPCCWTRTRSCSHGWPPRWRRRARRAARPPAGWPPHC